jgi:hypothetical protein
MVVTLHNHSRRLIELTTGSLRVAHGQSRRIVNLRQALHFGSLSTAPTRARLSSGIMAGGGPASVTLEAFTWLNNHNRKCENSMEGSYHGTSDRQLPRYLAEFCYPFNRRFKLEDMTPRLGYMAVRTPPMPPRPLRMVEPWRVIRNIYGAM